MKLNVNGHSGCKLELVKDRVRKIASNKNYSDRLFLQYKKQLKFKNKNISVPKIYDSGKDNDCFWFENIGQGICQQLVYQATCV